jgi:hypothetical protein
MLPIVTLILAFGLFACSGKGGSEGVESKAKASVDYDSELNPGEPSAFEPVQGSILNARPLKLSSNEVLQDALGYTMGSIAVTPFLAGTYTFKGRYLYAGRLSEMQPSIFKTLTEFCQGIGMESDEKGMRVWWRSHHTEARREALGLAIASGHRDIHCVMLMEDSESQPFYLSFDPLPLSPADVLGSHSAAGAVDASIMMMEVSSDLLLQPNSLLKVPEASPPFDTVQALSASARVPMYSSEVGEPCAYAAGSQTAVRNPSLQKEFTVKINSGVRVKESRSTPVSGKRLKACSDISLSISDNRPRMRFTCGAYQATKNEGLEAGCQWNLRLANELDPEDETIMTVTMPRLSFAGLPSTAWASGKESVAKSEANPIRTKILALEGFSPPQLAFLEKAFDLILEVSPDVFRQDFLGYMKSANLGTTGACATSGVMGFASVGSQSITLCPYMFGAGIDSPSAIVGAAHTIIHEVRHARGFFHDVDRPEYEPCMGTAYANVFDHDIVAVCQSSYCPLLKSSAEGSYLNDINYSLKSDNRRFIGLCKRWQADMGLSETRIRGGR